ncbi:MAG TPA: gfo/Idh/MocA family oxidoreductase, partial [Planctomycetaceae bacterium]|nr:gfo/Idh/MocA family oxidoreductase [Planctomycetaceae bacterium]
MSHISRRRFLRDTLVGSAAISAAPYIAKAQAPNDKLGVAVVGCRGRGASHLSAFASDPRTVVLYIVDVDEKVGAKRCEMTAKKQGFKPKFVRDMREAFRDPAVDLVSTA